MRVCGQWFDTPLRERIMATVGQEPALSRRALAERVCDWLNWTNAQGQRCLGSARRALAELQRRGAVTLPAATPFPAGPRPAPVAPAPLPVADVTGDLAALGPIDLVVVDTAAERDTYRQLLAHHPLGDKPLCGAQVRYLFRSAQGYLGAAAFQSASFALQDRDQWLGWHEATRRGNLARVVANARFLILPTVTVPHLASHLLGQLARRLPADWAARYGVRPLLLETFVHPDYPGTCYAAAGWECIGHSAGRRDGVPKALWVRPLVADARRQLCQGPRCLPAERPQAPADWTEEEFGGLKVWDARLKHRLYQLAADFWGDAQSRSLTRRCADRARTVAAYRFFRNPRINMQIILGAHREAVIARMGAQPLVLVPQDTTSLNYTGHPDTAGLGPIGSKTAGGPVGLVLHNSQAFTPEGVPLGVVSAECWARDPAEHQTRREPAVRESGKWLAAYRTLQAIAPQVPHTTLVSIGDREADLFELFALARDPASPRLLVRANRGRQRQVLTAEGLTPLWDHLAGLEVMGRLALHLPRRGAQPTRTAELELRCGPVTLKPPGNLKESPLALWAVSLREAAPPPGVDGVDWLLLTNVATTTLAEAQERVRWYGARWGIEVFHRTLKTGCQIEERQLGFVARLENCLAIDLVVAWRIYYLTLLGRMDPDAPCTLFFQDPEWQALYSWFHQTTVLPATPPTLQEATRWIAIKGGFQGRKADGHPGTQVLWQGLQKLDVAIEMYLIYRPEGRGGWREEYPPGYLRPPPEDTS
ncbi:MAG: IS4 family transposase [Chromatiaceae bacterium]|nr:IS4 family transposase [Chromatiaceae bacterium]